YVHIRTVPKQVASYELRVSGLQAGMAAKFTVPFLAEVQRRKNKSQFPSYCALAPWRELHAQSPLLPNFVPNRPDKTHPFRKNVPAKLTKRAKLTKLTELK